MCVRVDRAIQGENIIYGTLEEAYEDKIVLSYKVKTRTKKVEIEINNITKANLAVQI